MGLFGGGGSSTSSNVQNNTTSNVNDNRIGVADSATAVTAQGGSTISQAFTTNTSTTSTVNTQVVDSAAMTALAASIGTTSGDVANMVADLIEGVSETHSTVTALGNNALRTAENLFAQAQGTVDEALAQMEATANEAIRNSGANLTASLNFATGVNRDAFDFAEDVTDDLSSAYSDFASRLSAENDDQRAYSSQLVNSVLQQARTSDERNIDNFLSTSKWIVGLVVIAFVAPKVFGK